MTGEVRGIPLTIGPLPWSLPDADIAGDVRRAVSAMPLVGREEIERLLPAGMQRLTGSHDAPDAANAIREAGELFDADLSLQGAAVRAITESIDQQMRNAILEASRAIPALFEQGLTDLARLISAVAVRPLDVLLPLDVQLGGGRDPEPEEDTRRRTASTDIWRWPLLNSGWWYLPGDYPPGTLDRTIPGYWTPEAHP